jgi:hypothetical protein
MIRYLPLPIIIKKEVLIMKRQFSAIVGFIVLCGICLSLFAQQPIRMWNKKDITTTPSKLSSVAPEITGLVAVVSGSRVIIDIGMREGVRQGMVFTVLHSPAEGASEPVAEITVSEVRGTSSMTLISRGLSPRPAAVRDRVILKQ